MIEDNTKDSFGGNQVRERIKKKNSTDFSSSSLRRIALTQLGRKR